MRKAQIFVAVLGASSFTFAHASWTQTLPDWIDAHVRALEAIGGVPELIVPDNTKTAIVKACLYDPQVNRTYAEMAAHYGSAILPARPRKPRDKAKVEQAVLIVERWLLGRLRHRIFLRPGGRQRGDRRSHAPSQRGSTDPPARRDASTIAGRDRSSGAEVVAGAVLRVLGMESMSRRHRLSRRGRRPLLQRPVSLRSRRGRGAADRSDRRNLPQGRADRRSPARRRQSQAHDHSRTHAVQPSPLRGMDDRAHPRRRSADRASDVGALRVDPRISPASRAGLSGMPVSTITETGPQICIEEGPPRSNSSTGSARPGGAGRGCAAGASAAG